MTVCSATGQGVTPTAMPVYFDLDQDGCVRISSFKLREIVSVGVLKIDADHNPLPDWTSWPRRPGQLHFAEEQEEVTASGKFTGTAVFYLTPGKWIFSERPPGGHHGRLQPGDSQHGPPGVGTPERQMSNDPTTESDIRPGVFFYDGELVDYAIRFKNDTKIKGCIEVSKRDVVDDQIPELSAGRLEISVLHQERTTAKRRLPATPTPPATSGQSALRPVHGPGRVRSGWDSVTPSS
ncbi:MAG: hypothetical protein R2838_26350 [Caldilineaceae bacterium]